MRAASFVVPLCLILFPSSVPAGRAGAAPAVSVRWLGVAGFSLWSGDTALLHDPYLSRPPLWRVLLRAQR